MAAPILLRGLECRRQDQGSGRSETLLGFYKVCEWVDYE